MQATVRFSGLVASLPSIDFLIMLFEFLDASFSSFEYFAFEFYVHHFQTLRMFSSLRCLLFSSSQCY